MKIGIITWFSGSNYGTNLQAIALQRYLRNLGHETRIINYEVNAESVNRTFGQKVMEQPQKYVNKYAYHKYEKQIAKRDKLLETAIRENCLLTEKINSEQEFINICNTFDLLICGGDQIWNPNWYHRFYFADYDEIAIRRISYAPSMGVNTIPNERINDIRRSINKFAAISVREKSGVDLLKSLTDKKLVTVVDPTLLLSEAEWKELFPDCQSKETDYVLSMFLTDNSKHWHAAKQLAKSKGLRHVVIPYCGFSYMQSADICADAGLNELLNLIRGAKYILTDSFHITVFSIINRRQFYTFERFKEDCFSSTNNRIRNLLNLSGTEERFVPFGTKKINEIEDIDYQNVFYKMNIEIEYSKDFLKQSIGEIHLRE